MIFYIFPFRLYDQGHTVVGIECSEMAVKAFFQEQRLEYQAEGLSKGRGKLYQVDQHIRKRYIFVRIVTSYVFMYLVGVFTRYLRIFADNKTAKILYVGRLVERPSQILSFNTSVYVQLIFAVTKGLRR